MLDVKLLRSDIEYVKAALDKRGKGYDLSPFIALDNQRRKLIAEVEGLKAEQNAKSALIPKLKKEGGDTAALMEELKGLSDKIRGLDAPLKEVEAELDGFMMGVANIPHESLPVGQSHEDNEFVRQHLEPSEFTFEPKPHWELGDTLGIMDIEAAAGIAGSRFMLYRGMGAKLERALINLMLDMHDEHGYTEVLPPFIAHRRALEGVGQLPKFEEDVFKLENHEYFLISTAEVPLTNIHRESIIDGKDLTLNYCAYTPCFRSEAGAAGRDTRGLIRLHQFNKVEMVKFARPDESYAELERLTSHAEAILKALELPYKVMKLCTGDLGFSNAFTYDLEVWMPSYNRYVEISSCSNYTDFQARRANIRFKDKPGDKPAFVHTLNGSGLAIGRTFAAIIENFQQEDGSVKIPKALQPYMKGAEFIR